MEHNLHIWLLIYFIIYFGIVFLLKTIIVGKRIGKNPLVFPIKDESAFALIGQYFKLTMLSVFIYVLVFSIFSNWYEYFLPITFLENKWLKFTGILLLIISLIWTIIAQNNMKDSWRIGIDNETKTALIKNGLFKVSRNPIFLGILSSLVGLFFTTPNTVTLIFIILGFVLIQIQIRLEEAFLEKQHGNIYKDYKQNTRRFI